MQAPHQGQILIVDDEPEVVRLYQLLLGELGHQVSSAQSGESALEHVSSQPLDILITDIRMPGMSGLELIRKALVLEPDLQCIIISGVSDQDSAIEAIKLGALHYLRKPVDFNELALSVSQGLARVQLIREARQSRRSLEQETNKNRLILETAGAGIIGLDAQCLVTFINGTALALLGLEGQPLFGTSLTEKISYLHESGSHYPAGGSPLGCGLPAHKRIEGEGSFNGSSMSGPLPIYFVSTPMEEQGREIGRVLVFRDIRRERLADEALRRAKRSAEEASHIQSRFLSNMSHELRAPLNTILAHARSLQDELNALDTPQRNKLEEIESSGQTLLALIDELLEMARIDAGAFHLTPARSYLPLLLEEFHHSLRAQLRQRGILLHYYESQHLPYWVQVDQKYLLQLLNQLAECMQRIIEPNAITLTIGWHNNALQIELADVLTSSKLLSLPLAPDETETLSLLLCRRLAHAMGGKVKLVFDELHRFRLNCTLPLTRSMGESNQDETTSAELQLVEWNTSPTYRLLLAAAPGSERDALEETLTEAGLEILIEEQSTAILRRCEQGDVDLLLLDWSFEELQPEHLILQLRVPYPADQLPILLLCKAEQGGCPPLPPDCQEQLALPLQREALFGALTRHLTRRLPLLKNQLPCADEQRLNSSETGQIRQLIQHGRVVELRDYLCELERSHHDCSLLQALQLLARRFDFRSILQLLDESTERVG